MDNISEIKVKCYIALNDTEVDFDNFKKIIEEKNVLLEQYKNKELALLVGEEEKEIIAYGNLIMINGRYGIQITELL